MQCAPRSYECKALRSEPLLAQDTLLDIHPSLGAYASLLVCVLGQAAGCAAKTIHGVSQPAMKQRIDAGAVMIWKQVVALRQQFLN